VSPFCPSQKVPGGQAPQSLGTQTSHTGGTYGGGSGFETTVQKPKPTPDGSPMSCQSELVIPLGQEEYLQYHMHCPGVPSI